MHTLVNNNNLGSIINIIIIVFGSIYFFIVRV